MKAVNAGEIPAGVIYHYYWYKDRAESGANSANTELHLFPQGPRRVRERLRRAACSSPASTRRKPSSSSPT